MRSCTRSTKAYGYSIESITCCIHETHLSCTCIPRAACFVKLTGRKLTVQTESNLHSRTVQTAVQTAPAVKSAVRLLSDSVRLCQTPICTRSTVQTHSRICTVGLCKLLCKLNSSLHSSLHSSLRDVNFEPKLTTWIEQSDRRRTVT